MTTEMFDDLVDLTQPEDPTTEAPAQTTSEPEAEWPKKVDSVPEGSKTVQEFADHIKALLVEKLVSEGKSLYEAVAADSRINPNSVYQYAKRDNNPMPSYLVSSVNDDGTPGDPKIFIPTQEATEWWMNRPERGGSGTSGPTAEQDIEKLLYKAGKKANLLERLQVRLVALTEMVEKQSKLRDRYGERLEEAGKTWDEANAAFQNKVEEDADKESADSEIEG